MAHIDGIYGELVNKILKEGFEYTDSSRGHIGMLEIPSHTLEIDMAEGFPLLTTKFVSWRTVAHELIWMLSGSESIKYLQDNNVKIWDIDAKNFMFEDDHVGRIYGYQWRNWCGAIDQFRALLQTIRGEGLYNRRNIVTAWNPMDLPYMALPPCHWAFQVMPTRGGFGIKWHQRSCDTFLGIPFDIALYAMLGKMLEHEIDLPFTDLIGDLSCVHFYKPHIELAKMQMGRKSIECYPWMHLGKGWDLNKPFINDIDITGYSSHSAIPAKMYGKV